MPRKKINEDQKFHPGDFVKVSNKMPPEMSHFPKGFIGMVIGSYQDQYGGEPGPNTEYSLIQFNNNGKVINFISWYPERLLDRFDGYNLMNWFKKQLRLNDEDENEYD